MSNNGRPLAHFHCWPPPPPLLIGATWLGIRIKLKSVSALGTQLGLPRVSVKITRFTCKQDLSRISSSPYCLVSLAAAASAQLLLLHTLGVQARQLLLLLQQHIYIWPFVRPLLSPLSLSNQG